MIPRPPPPLAAAALVAVALAAPSLRAADPPPAAPTVPLSATSQCVEGPGAPPADPSKVTRVVPGQGAAAPAPAPAPAEEPAIDAPGQPDRILLELGVSGGASARLDDSPELVTADRAGFAYGGSIFVWPSRSLAFGATYTHADLSRSTTPKLSPDVINVDYGVHALMIEARAAPFRLGSSAALFATIGGGLAWQTAGLRATLAPVNGSPGGPITCGFGSNAELAFRAGLGLKARLGRAGALLVDGNFTGYHLSSAVMGDCWYGTGTAATLMLRVGLAYDLDVTPLFR